MSLLMPTISIVLASGRMELQLIPPKLTNIHLYPLPHCWDFSLLTIVIVITQCVPHNLFTTVTVMASL